MGHLRQNISLLVANLLVPVAVLVFAAGFFRYKPFLPDLAGAENQQLADDGGMSEGAPFDKVVFMVVDALRRSSANLVAYANVSHTNCSQRLHILCQFRFWIYTEVETVLRYRRCVAEGLTAMHPHTLRRGHSLYRSREPAQSHHLSHQGHDNWLKPFFLGCDPQPRRLGGRFHPRRRGYMARASQGERKREAGLLRREHMAPALSGYLRSHRWGFNFLRSGEGCRICDFV